MNGLLTLPNFDVDVESSPAWVSQKTDQPDVRLLVHDDDEFEEFIHYTKPYLVERATNSVSKVLREIDSWENNVGHEKLAIRLGFELVERFIDYGREKVPCRPILLLDSYLAKSFSLPDFLFSHREALATPLGVFLEGLISRAVLSRDALVSLFWHLYNLSPSQVINILGLTEDQSQRIFKNFSRWRKSGWEHSMSMIGITETELASLEAQGRQNEEALNRKACQFLDLIQPFYRKSEPDHYPCLTAEQWTNIYAEGYGQNYRIWHLAMCRHCFKIVADSRIQWSSQQNHSLTHLQFRPSR
jgi:hypothetical protein